MAKVTLVAKARKSPGPCGKCGEKIKAGDAYRWWKFRFGGKHVRCVTMGCRPRPSDLTQSEFYGTLYSIQETIQDACTEARVSEDASALIEEARSQAEELRGLGSEQEDKLSNMPEGLQQGDTGQLLQTRAEECQSKADELEQAADSAASSWDDRDATAPEEADEQKTLNEVIEELEGVDLSID